MIPLQNLRICLIDDDEEDYLIIKSMLDDATTIKYFLDHNYNFETGLSALDMQTYDVYLIDYRLGAKTGLDLLDTAAKRGWSKPMILLTGQGDHEVDMEAMRKGAADYLVKREITPPLLERSIRFAVKRQQDFVELKRREESFRSLLQATFEGLIVHEYGEKILTINEATEHIFGFKADELIGKSVHLLFPPDLDEGAKQRFRSRKEEKYEISGIRKDGSEVALEIAGREISYQGQKVRLSTFRDISERKQMEAQILMQDRLASIGLLASSLAHEIGTPLGVIRGRAELVMLHGKENISITNNSKVIIAQIDRISQLVRSLLNLARGEKLSNLGRVPLNRVITDVLDLLSHELRKHDIRIMNEVAHASSANVLGEAGSLHQVLLNILVNSIHAIEQAIKNGKTHGHHINLTVDEEGSFWVLRVTDTGCGISKLNMKNLFKPFFTTKDVGVGTGLGLVTSYRIVESWGGKISADSQEGVGATFSIHLPKAPKSVV